MFMHERKRRAERHRIAALAMIGLVAAAAAQGPGMTPANLEIIVKFTNDSEPGRRIERLLSEGSQDLGGLAEAEAALEASTGVPLTRERITSGREIVFSIPERPLLETVQKEVARRADVESTSIETLQSDNPNLPAAELVVRFRESSDAFAALSGSRDDGAQTLADAIANASGVPLTGVARGRGELALGVDRAALLASLSARLNDRDDVDYAQPNATMQIMK